MAKELTKDERIIVRGYKEGLKNIRKDINLLYEKHAKDGKLSAADLSKYNRLTNLEKNIADNLKTAYDVQVRTTKKAVKGAFESAFYYGTFELEQEAKIPLMFGLLKKEAVNAVVEGPHRWPQIAKGHTKLTNAKIRDQIMQGVVQGKDAGQVTKAVAKEMNIAASKACRIVRTETHRAQNQGSLDSFMEASKKGVIIQKVWVATLDERTRASHRVMDGQIVEINEEFIMPGDIKALAPGLSGSASSDINCRCIIRAEVVGYSPQARRSREDGIIPQQTYQQWAKAKGIKFDDKMADEVKKLLEARGVSKKVIEKVLKEKEKVEKPKALNFSKSNYYNSLGEGDKRQLREAFEKAAQGDDIALKFVRAHNSRADFDDKIKELYAQVLESYNAVKKGKKPLVVVNKPATIKPPNIAKTKVEVKPEAAVKKEKVVEKIVEKASKEIDVEVAKQVDKGFKRLNKLAKESTYSSENAMGIKAIEEIVRKQSADIQKSFVKYMSKFKGFIDDKGRGGFHLNRKINVDFSKALMDRRGKYTTFFHEFGHFVDDSAGTLSIKYGKEFYKLIEEDYRAMLNPSGTIKGEIRTTLEYNHATHGVQDVISGLSLNSNRVRWGHSTEYWTRGNTKLEITSETFASMYGSLFNENIADAFKSHMPKSYEYFVNVMLKEMIS